MGIEMRGAMRSARRNPRTHRPTTSVAGTGRKIQIRANIQSMRSTCARSRGPVRCCPGRSTAGHRGVDSRPEPNAKGHGGSASEPKSSTATIVNAEIEALRPNVRRAGLSLSGRLETIASANARCLVSSTLRPEEPACARLDRTRPHVQNSSIVAAYTNCTRPRVSRSRS